MHPVLKACKLPIRAWLLLTLFALSSFRGYAIPASIITHPADVSRCPYSDAGFSVTAIDAVSYQWQVNMGSGFEDIVDGGTYFGATTADLILSAIPEEMNGYLYQCVVTGSTGPDAISNPATLSISSLQVGPEQTSVSCFGQSDGTAKVVLTGGSGVYSYLWTASGNTSDFEEYLSAGVYECEISDGAGCTMIQSFEITQPDQLVAVPSFTDITCAGLNNGAASVSLTGGTGPFNYFWDNNQYTDVITGLAPGNYSCYITDAGGCESFAQVTISEPVQLTVVPSYTNVSCSGQADGSATVAVSGGTGPYTYSWSPAVSTDENAYNLAAGTYTCTITDAGGCSVTETFNITEPDALTVTPSIAGLTCPGGGNASVTLNVTGGTGSYTFYWLGSGKTADTESGLAAGNYDYTVTDANGCEITGSVEITDPTPVTSTSTSTPVSCFGAADGTATVTGGGGTPGYSYEWVEFVAFTPTVTGLAAGTYNYIVYDLNGCGLSFSVDVGSPLALASSTTQV
ncbi:MAG: SprB repeat-containing protein, partial [Chitinophagaceae bacterium]